MIEIKGLYKKYHNHHNDKWVLENINIQIPKNTSVGLIGSNGAGKSTLLRLIAGMDYPDKGVVRRNCRVSWPIGLSGGFQGSMTGRQNTKFVARVHGSSDEVERIIEEVESFAEIGEAFDEPVNTYSSGMRSRLGFGLSLAFNFDVYLSDEATAVGDRAFKAKASKAFKDKVGKSSLIMVSHSEGILKELCQAGIYIKNGRAEWYDDIKDAIREYHEDIKTKNISEHVSKKNNSFEKSRLQSLVYTKKELRRLFEFRKQAIASDCNQSIVQEIDEDIDLLKQAIQPLRELKGLRDSRELKKSIDP